MASLIAAPQSLSLRGGTSTFTTAKVSVNKQTAAITVRLRRPTTAAPLSWTAASALRVTIIVDVDGTEYRCVGKVSGGVRTSGGVEAAEYVLSYRPPVVMRNGVARRIAETGAAVSAQIILERLGTRVDTEVLEATTVDSPAPPFAPHHSVAFDAATDASESFGDGVLSLAHTSTGSNLAVFAGVAYRAAVAGSTSVTYGGTGMTEMWDVASTTQTEAQNAGYRLAGQATGAQTVTSTIASTEANKHALSVISMSGVDQTTPVGTHATGEGTTSPATATVGSVGADDMVVDNLLTLDVGAPTVGANQTERCAEAFGDGHFSRASTQAGSDGGVMSWTLSGGPDWWVLGAVAFLPAAAGPAGVAGYHVGAGHVGLIR